MPAPRCALLLASIAGFLLQGQGLSVPTQAQIQQMMDAGSYRPAARAIAQAMPQASGNDKYALLMMRAECMMQVKDAGTALMAYEQAAGATDDLQRIETARAGALLLKKSVNFAYTPRTGTDRKAIDVIGAESRKQAMAALFADELETASKPFAQAVKARTLPTVTALVPTLRDLHALEVTATGDDARTVALVQPVADHVHDLISGDLDRVNAQVSAIQRAAERTVDYGGGSFQTVNGRVAWVPGRGNSGLTTEQRQALRETVAYLGKITQTCDDLTALARRYEGDSKRWQALAKQSRSIANFAAAVYDHE